MRPAELRKIIKHSLAVDTIEREPIRLDAGSQEPPDVVNHLPSPSRDRKEPIPKSLDCKTTAFFSGYSVIKRLVRSSLQNHVTIVWQT
tara:strand:+ start:544 stop:807 length:264 start_codon:yes stop_codon:yes gene_type:complete